MQDIATLKTDGINIKIGNNVTKNCNCTKKYNLLFKIIRKILIYLTGSIKNYSCTGSLLFCAGGTPAAAMLGGFKQSVSAYRLRRSCMVQEWQNHFRESDF